MWHHLRNGLTVLIALLAVTVGVSTPQAQPAERFALVVGNGGYRHIEPLRNPVPDAEGVAAALTALGFRVLIGTDLGHSEFRKLLDEFVRDSSGASEVLFYYAGHGFQLGNVNRLVPVDASLLSRNLIDTETVSLNDVIKAIKITGRRSVILLDACRNNPLPAALRQPGDGDGLAEIDTGQDLFVAFATQPGNVALDGKGRHSPFTKALLTHMTREGMSISDMMVDLRKDVFISTQGAQVPWDQSSLRSQFYFAPTASLIDSQAAALRNKGNAAELPTSAEPLDEFVIVEGLEPETAGADPPEKIVDAGAGAVIAEPPAAKVLQEDANPIEKVDPVVEKKDKLKSTAQKAKGNPVAVKKAKPKNTTAKTALKKTSKATLSRKARPNALDYSRRIWGRGSMRSGTRRQETEYGTLVCGNPSRVRGARSCHWE